MPGRPALDVWSGLARISRDLLSTPPAARGVCHMNPTGLGMALSKIPFFFFIFSTRKQRGQRTHRAARQQQQGRAMALQGAAHQGPALGHLQHRLGGLREGREETSPQTCAGEDPDGEGFSLR